MADRIILRPLGDDAQSIVDAFAERTGLTPAPASGGGTEFPLEGEEHRIKVVGTLSEIDPSWESKLELGDPAETDRPGDADADLG